MPSEHTQEIRAVRAMEKTYGITRTQARFALHKAATQAALERQVRQAQQPAPPPAPSGPKSTTTVVATPSKPFFLKGDPGPRGEAGIPGPAGSGIPPGYEETAVELCDGTPGTFLFKPD